VWAFRLETECDSLKHCQCTVVWAFRLETECDSLKQQLARAQSQPSSSQAPAAAPGGSRGGGSDELLKKVRAQGGGQGSCGVLKGVCVLWEGGADGAGNNGRPVVDGRGLLVSFGLGWAC